MEDPFSTSSSASSTSSPNCSTDSVEEQRTLIKTDCDISKGDPMPINAPFFMREWGRLTSLISQIPEKAQKGLQTMDLRLTTVAAAEEIVVIGTSVGVIYWYNRRLDKLDRLRPGDANNGSDRVSPITQLALRSSVDFVLASGSEDGLLSVFLVPRDANNGGDGGGGGRIMSFLNDNSLDATKYDLKIHPCRITALEWSQNGMKCFSGDAAGNVCLTELDFIQEEIRSRPLLQERYEVVQLSYCSKLLLVCTTEKALVLSLESNVSRRVGTQDRKVFGPFGGTLIPGKNKSDDMIYSVRPGGRVWLADPTGVVHHTVKIKDLLCHHQSPSLPSSIPVMNPRRHSNAPTNFGDLQLSRLIPLDKGRGTCLTSFRSYLIAIDPSPAETKVLGLCTELHGLLDYCVNAEEGSIFVLEGDRSLLRLSTDPDPFPPLKAAMMMRDPGDPFAYLTSKIKKTSKLITRQGEHARSRLRNINSSQIVSSFKQILEADMKVTDGRRVVPTPDVAVSAEEEMQPDMDDVVDNVVVDKFGHISHLPFDDVLLAPPVKGGSKVRKKRRKKKGKDLVEGGGVLDTVSLTSSMCSEFGGGVVMGGGVMSQSWAAGEGGEDDLATKEEILARKLNWPELLPEGRNKFVVEELEMDSLNDDDCDYHDGQGEEDVLAIQQEDDGDEGDGDEPPPQLEEEEQTLEEDLIEDIYTKYAPKEDHSSSVLSFGPPSNNTSSNTPSSSSLPSFLQPKLIEISGNREMTPDLLPVRDLVVDPESEGNPGWLKYTLPCALHSLCGSDLFLFALDKNGRVYFSEFSSATNSLRWEETRFRAQWISVSPCSRILWRVNKKGTLYSLVTGGKKDFVTALREPVWVKVVERDVVGVSVGSQAAWLVKKDGTVWTCSGLLGTPVTPDLFLVSKSPKMVDIASDMDLGRVWGLSQEGRLFRRKGVTEGSPHGSEWVEKSVVEGSIGSIGLGPACSNLLFFTFSDSLHFVEVDGSQSYNCYDSGSPSSCSWEVGLRGLERGSGSPPGSDDSPSPVSSSPSSSSNPFSLSSLKSRLKSNKDRVIKDPIIMTAGGNCLFFARRCGTVLFRASSLIEGHRWVCPPLRSNRPLRFPSTWVGVAASGIYRDHGALWLQDEKGKIFFLLGAGSGGGGGDVRPIDLPTSKKVVQVSPAPDALWILNRDGMLYARENISELCPVGHGWAQVDLNSLPSTAHLVHVSCGSDVAWGCDSEGRVFMRKGSLKPPTSPHDISPAWIPVAEEEEVTPALSKVWVSSSGTVVWGLDMSRNIWVREAVYSDFPIGLRWLLVSGMEAVDLALSDSAVWALSANGDIFRRSGLSPTNFLGDAWLRVPGPSKLAAITASLCDQVWGLLADNGGAAGSVLRHWSHDMDLTGVVDEERRRREKIKKLELDDEDKDWEVVESLDVYASIYKAKE